MKKRVIISVILLFVFSSTALSQKMIVKDSDLNVLMEVNDEGTKGSITLSKFAAGTGPTTPTDKLYNVDGALYWNGSALGMAGSAGGWTDGGTDVYLTTSTDNVGIGTTSPGSKLEVAWEPPTSNINPIAVFKTTGATSSAGAIRVQNTQDNKFCFGITPHPGNEFAIAYNTNINLSTDLLRITSTGNVGIGDTSPTNTLDVAGTVGINDTQILYLPDQTDFLGTLILGDGGGSLSHSVDSTGWYNTAVGIGALDANEEGAHNTASGYVALNSNTSGNYNTANGSGALFSNTTGNSNVGIGYRANYNNEAGSNNTIIGYQAGLGKTTHNKSGNVFIGYQAGHSTHEADNYNIFIGYEAGYSETESNKLYIENSNSSSPLIGGDFSADELYFNGDVGIRKTSPGAALDVDGRIHAAAHAASKGLRLPTNAGPPGAVSGTSEGDIVWDSSNDNLYVYDGTSFSYVGGGSGLWESGTNGVYEDDAGVIVGIDQPETISFSSFYLGMGDLFIQDELGVERNIYTDGMFFGKGNVYTDGSFVAGNKLSIADGSITQSTGFPITVNLGGGSGDDFIVDTSTLVVESDNDRVGIGITAPAYPLDVDSTIGISNTQVLYLPNQTKFEGTLILGDGGGSLSHISGDQGRYNTAVGIGALNANTNGYGNTASGWQALNSNTEGDGNIASGYQALFSNTLGSYNIATGYLALNSNDLANYNIATGDYALYYNRGGTYDNDAGCHNIATGSKALLYNQYGKYNIATGFQALYNNMGCDNVGEGSYNIAIGYQSLFNNIGAPVGPEMISSNNIAVGYQALYNNSTGNGNVALGSYSGTSFNGDYNTFVGYSADATASSLTNATAIGYNAKVDASNKVRVGNDSVTVIEGQVDFTYPSDSNKKENFLEVDGEEILNKISSLNLTSWNYKGHDPVKSRHYGPMGQDFFRAFGHDEMGTIGSDTTLCGSDVAGINMIAIQALEKRTRELQNRDSDFTEENEKLKTEIVQLKNLVADLRENLQRLESRLASSESDGGNRDVLAER